MPRRFECKDGSSSKFWEIEVSGAAITTWWGRIGTGGQSKTKDFASDAQAESEYEKLVSEKTRKGYVEIGASSAGVKSANSTTSTTAEDGVGDAGNVAVLLQPKPAADRASESKAQSILSKVQAGVSKLQAGLSQVQDSVSKASVEGNVKKQTVNVPQAMEAIFRELKEQLRVKVAAHKPVHYLVGPAIKISEFPSVEPIFKMSPDQQAEALFIVLNQLKSILNSREFTEALEQIATRLSKRALPLNEDQLATLIQRVEKDYPYGIFTANSILTQVEQFVANGIAGPSLSKALKKLESTLSKGNWHYSTGPDAAGQKLIHRIQMLLERTPTGDVPIPIAPQEAWSDQAIADLQALDDQSRQAWVRLLEHCGHTTGTSPSGSWSKRANELVSAIGDEEFITYLHKWFSLVPKKGSRTGEEPGGWGVDAADVIRPQNAELLKGLAFCCAGRTDARLASALGDAAETSFKKVTGLGPRCPKLGTACVHSLASMNTKESIAQLTRVQAKAKHASVRTQIEKALNNAATKSGMSVDDLQDIGVPDFGMQEVGQLVLNIGTWSAQLTIEDSNSIAVSWISSGGKTQQSVPAEIKTGSADKVKELKKTQQELEKLLPGLRNRMERSFIEQRHWRFDQWRERYLDHPVTGTMARRLLWTFNGRAGIWFGGQFVDQTGSSFIPEESALVELWHPIGSDPHIVLEWRRWLAEHRIVQPFKQCHREIYVLTDAEIQTGTYSNRFATHILKQHQLQHLCMQRGWQYQLMGSFDSQSTPTLQLPRWDLAVELFVDIPHDSNEVGIYSTVGSDKVQFLRRTEDKNYRNDYIYQPVSLTEIMPIVFSEVMRDVDLFISVCSIGTDPNWTAGHHDYWNRYSFGDLSNTAETRRQVLGDIIPHLKIASRCRLDSKFLIVRGDLRTYKIHFGSGNILMEPNDQYLCIVAARGLSSSTERVFLPFEGDTMLSLILSKAMMLAEDSKIKDSSILSQIKHKS